MSRRGKRGKFRPSQGQAPQQQNRVQPKSGARDHGSGEQRVQPSGENVVAAASKAGGVITSVVTPRRQISRKQMHQRSDNPTAKKYGVIFYETLQAAKADIDRLKNLAQQYDQLNIVLRAEGGMDDVELNGIGKVFAGAAWSLIHERRKLEGWYPDQPQ